MSGEQTTETTRRSVLKSAASTGVALSAFAGTGMGSTPGWTGLTATYRVESSGDDRPTQTIEYDVEVVDKQKNNLIVEVRAGDSTSRSAIPMDVAQQPIRGTKSRRGSSQEFVRQADDEDMSTVRGSVTDGWFDSFHSVREEDGETLLELDVELLDYEDVPGRSNRGVVILPQIIPPDSQVALGDPSPTSTTDTVSSGGITTADVTQYGYSTLITKDNQPANLTTSKTELQCWGRWDGSTYTEVGGNVDVTTAINWSKTGESERRNPGSDSYAIDVDFYGNFPAGLYTDWKNRHQHTHFFNDGNNHDPNLYGRLERRIPSQSWELHKTKFWDNGNYAFGERLTGKWYII